MNTSQSSGSINVAGSKALSTGSGLLTAVTINTDGTNVATVSIYNNTAASGDLLFQASVPAANLTEHFYFPQNIRASKGMYVSVVGVGATAIVYTG